MVIHAARWSTLIWTKIRPNWYRTCYQGFVADIALTKGRQWALTWSVGDRHGAGLYPTKEMAILAAEEKF